MHIPFYSPIVQDRALGKRGESMSRLTNARANKLTKPGLYGDGGTLYLNIARGGSKSWVQRVTIDGKRHDIGLGGYPFVGLGAARQKALHNRVAIAAGRDPLAERRRSTMPTFAVAARRTCEALSPGWRNRKHTVSWMQTLERHAFPVLGGMTVDRIAREDVLRVLTPIWASRPETARRVRQRIRATLQWAWAHGYVTTNVAGEGINGALPKLPSVKVHFKALPYSEVAEALRAMDGSRASLAAKLCFRFLVLTAARSGEARGASWSEIDVTAREWRIPADRMKAHTDHRVPLSRPALTVLERARALDDGSGLVFPSSVKRGTPLSDMTLTKLLRTRGIADRATVHGFRSSFRDWASECTDTPHAVMELSLAHRVGSNVEQAYARSDLLAKRRALMEQWGAFVAEGGRDV